uniref:Uncharacterized protein n=1 Tax=Utricularia reniformis TaxID=192314 RepID=A0A1Y0B1U4_9LAMI|nr:hypothetical protein AEK19_MT1211 [Utricularia reniformis]ART31425.1 hypothetical protein AEK19_MT1211 [Utricularia reniformis]
MTVNFNFVCVLFFFLLMVHKSVVLEPTEFVVIKQADLQMFSVLGDISK